MEAKRFNGKAIYQPSGKAGEYAAWACNFFTGCSNNCDYCYCKRGVMSHVWDTVPHLKKCFKDEEHATDVFIREMEKNIDALRHSGIFFSFTTDPLLPETLEFHMNAVCLAIARDIPVQLLTKRADFLDYWLFNPQVTNDNVRSKIAVGFTLTACDELEGNSSSNNDRIRALLKLHDRGYKTFASVEPVINAPSAYYVINTICGNCDLIKVGLLSGKRNYKPGEIEFLYDMISADRRGSKFYIKDSMVDYLHLDRASMPEHFVNQDYNIFQRF